MQTPWLPVLVSPAIWFASFLAAFAVAPLTCAHHSNGLLWLISGLALALNCLNGFAAWRIWERTPGWLAMSGILVSAGFFIVIAAQAIPSLLMPGCQ